MSAEASIERKLARLRAGGSPRVLDLFSGCGGLMVGFTRAGCTSIGGVEIDRDAARTYAQNFHSNDPGYAVHACPKDITRVTAAELLRDLGRKPGHDVVDLLVGGPPCPTFTRVGRAKLREVQQHPEAFRQDPRARLYVPYLEYVQDLRPVALLMENVPDFLNWGGHNLAEEIAEVLEGLGYRCWYTLLNAANHGVPQMRERFFLVAIHSAADARYSFPTPTHFVKFPPGYEGARDVALKPLRVAPLFGPRPRFVATPPVPPRAFRPVSVLEAIGDLPDITAHLDGSMKRGARRFDTPVVYRSDREPSAYARLLREWPGFESSGFVTDHVIRSLSQRDYRLFRHMRSGDDYPEAHALAIRLLDKELEGLRRKGRVPAEGSSDWKALRQNFVPPYDVAKFPNKWRKMEPRQPARTLMAHLGKDSYSHIHYDSRQARVISVREAARLQSFPDGFRFDCTMNPAFRQIGNAVPPLLALALARSIGAALAIPQKAEVGAISPALPVRKYHVRGAVRMKG